MSYYAYAPSGSRHHVRTSFPHTLSVPTDMTPRFH